MSIFEKLKSLNLDEKKIEEVKRQRNLQEKLQKIIDSGNELNQMQYQMACLAPKNADIKLLSDVIATGCVVNDSLLKGILSSKLKTKDELVKFCKDHTYSTDEIKKYIAELKEKNLTKLQIRSESKNKYKYYDTKILYDELKDYGLNVEIEKYKKNWLDEGEIKLLHKAGENKQVNEQIMKEHLERTGGKVVTRFPPEPNGNLHIGHAKALNLSFEYAKKYRGITYMRFDDTNPKNEADELYDGILEDVKWLGFEPYAITASSDYFDDMLEMSKKLLKKGSAYIDFCSLEEIRNRRVKYQKERDSGHDDPSLLSPYRNTEPNENLNLFDRMLKGEFKDGEAVLRFKMPLESKNPLMLDLVGARIIDMEHARKKRNFMVYPTYEFALCVSDSIEDVTHSFCSREFYTRQEPYHWLLQELKMYEPVQWEFSRLNVSNTVLSKRKLTKLVEKGLGWDDPRFYTIKGMRRRGFPASAINAFVQSVGITFSDCIVDCKILESFVSKELYKTAKKATCLMDPLKIYINKKAKGIISEVEVDINKIIYIDRSDFMEEDDKKDTKDKFLRLTPTNPVGLIGCGVLKYVGKETDGIRCELLTKEECKVSKNIQWLPNLNNKVEIRWYTPLFTCFNPEEGGFMNNINLEGSLQIKTGYVDSTVLSAAVEDKFQFIRIGYFCCDKDSTFEKDKKLVFNLTLELNKGY